MIIDSSSLAKNDAALDESSSSSSCQQVSAKLWGVGVGPGDPELITLKAIKAIMASDILVVPQSSPERESIALRVVKEALSLTGLSGDLPKVEGINFPMKISREEVVEQIHQEIDQKVVSNIQKGKQLSFITLGDPLFYSTYRHVKDRLQESLEQDIDYKIEHIPGIYSFTAICAKLGEDLGEGRDKLAVVPVNKDQDYQFYLKQFDNLVFLKAISDLSRLVDDIHLVGRSEEAVLVEKVGHADERIHHDLSEIRNHNIHYLSTVIISKRTKEDKK